VDAVGTASSPKVQTTRAPAAVPPPLPKPVLSYATPVGLAAPAQQGGVWAKGRDVVVHRAGALPPRCIKCGAPAVAAPWHKMYWYPPLAYLALLAGLLPGAIVLLICQKKHDLPIPLCEAHHQRRNTLRYTSWGLAAFGLLAGAGSLPLCISLGRDPTLAIRLALVAAAALIASGIVSLLARPLRPRHMDHMYCTYRGAGPEFLQSLDAI
jgi:hypothetical protein